MGKYEPLDAYFAALAGDRHEMSFDEIEALLKFALPPTALERPEWWANARQHAFWMRHGWRARPRLVSRRVLFTKDRLPSSRAPVPSRALPPTTDPTDLILIGCVSEKLPHAARARELFVSPLFRGRRAYAEQSGKPWFILSAKHGLLDPERTVEPYDVSLARASERERREWARAVVPKVIAAAGTSGASRIEIHAGAAYCESGLRQSLEALGFQVSIPLAHLRIGEQIAWYGSGGSVGPGRSPLGETKSRRLAIKTGTPTGEHVRLVADDFISNERLGGGWAALPEVRGVRAISENGADPIAVRIWITFMAAMDRARDADRLWNGGVRLWRDAQWAFTPAEVAARPIEDLAAVLQTSGVSQRHGPDSRAWHRIAVTLASNETPEGIGQAINGERVEARDLLAEVVASSRRNREPLFPMLRGPKISAMWVRMLAYPGNAPIQGLAVVPVAVDTHVKRVSEMLGLVPHSGLDYRHRRRIQDAWFACVRLAGAFGAPSMIDSTAAGIDPAIWALGRSGCSTCEQAGELRPIPNAKICSLCQLQGTRHDESHH